MSGAARSISTTFPAKLLLPRMIRLPPCRLIRRSALAASSGRADRSLVFGGVCHSDLHQVRKRWKEVMPTVYPLFPGHEIVGRVVKVGRAVKKFKEGDIAAVGCMVDSCAFAPACKAAKSSIASNSRRSLTLRGQDFAGVTFGGYSRVCGDEAVRTACT